MQRTLWIASVAAAAMLAASAWAGEFYEKGGVALRGYDPVAYFTDHKPVPGLPEHRAEHKGSVFLFASKANRDRFVADPAFGAAGGYKAAIDPAAYTIVDGKLYLNYNKSVQKQWSADVPGYVAKADRNWPEVSKQTRVVE